MLRFSKKEDYAIILIDELVKHYNKELVPLSSIAKRHTLSLFFLRNVANTFKNAHIIEAVEGKNGGYKLAKDPQSIYIGDILRIASGYPLFSCCQKTSDGKCRAQKCPHGLSIRRISNQFMGKIYKLNLIEAQKI